MVDWYFRAVLIVVGILFALLALFLCKKFPKKTKKAVDFLFFMSIGVGIVFFIWRFFDRDVGQDYIFLILTFFLIFPAFYYFRMYLEEIEEEEKKRLEREKNEKILQRAKELREKQEKETETIKRQKKAKRKKK